MAALVDNSCLVLAFVAPVLLVLSFDLRGVVYGTFVHWWAGAIAGIWLSAIDDERDAAILDHVWLLFGWIQGLLYCLAVYGAKQIVIRLMGVRKATQPNQEHRVEVLPGSKGREQD